MTERLANSISGGFLLAIALAMGVMAQGLPTTITDQYAGPGFMPTLLSICVALCAVGILVQAQTLPSSQRMPGWGRADVSGAIRIAGVLAATAAYNFLLQPVGYLLVTFCYLLFLLWYLKVRLRTTLILSTVMTLLTYFLFSVWLRVVLPSGLTPLYF